MVYFRIFTAVLFISAGIFTSDAWANPKFAELVINAKTGKILEQENAGKLRYPASLTKLMTLYLTFEALEKNALHMNQRLVVSKRASKQPRSHLGLRAGERISVRDAVDSLIVKSANDVAVVLAEAIAGSEWQFAMMMTRKARALGMRFTTFRNASGLHDPKQRTTAYDMARLAMALERDFPKFYPLFSKPKFAYKGRTYKSHNKVQLKYRGADGLKTGYIRASGFNLITSVDRPEGRVIAVVMGGKTGRSRDRHMVKLLDRNYKKLYQEYAALQRKNISAPTFKPGSTQVASAATQTQAPRLKPAFAVPQPKPESPIVRISSRSTTRYDDIRYILERQNTRSNTQYPSPLLRPAN